MVNGGAPEESSLDSEAQLFVRLFDNIHHLIPLNKETLKSVLGRKLL